MQLDWGVPRDCRSTFKVMEITVYSGENYENLIKVNLSYFPKFLQNWEGWRVQQKLTYFQNMPAPLRLQSVMNIEKRQFLSQKLHGNLYLGYTRDSSASLKSESTSQFLPERNQQRLIPQDVAYLESDFDMHTQRCCSPWSLLSINLGRKLPLWIHLPND